MTRCTTPLSAWRPATKHTWELSQSSFIALYICSFIAFVTALLLYVCVGFIAFVTALLLYLCVALLLLLSLLFPKPMI